MSKELCCFISGSLGGAMIHRIIDVCTHRLLSCHGPYFGVAKKWMSMAHAHPESKNREIMLDSGAFSAWSQGGEAHLSDVIRAYDEILDRYADSYKDIWLINLDKIPGEKGRSATLAEIEDAVRISDENFSVLQKRFGDRVLPVFHQDETPARLREVLAQNPRYICVSPRNDVPESLRREWSQRTHELCGDTWTHGLAATGVKMMTDVPWRSIDSASWTSLAGHGQIMVSIGRRLFVVDVSDDKQTRRELGRHVDTLPKPELDEVMKVLERVDVKLEDVRKSYDVRAFVNVFYYQDFVKRNGKFQGSTVQQTLFTL